MPNIVFISNENAVWNILFIIMRVFVFVLLATWKNHRSVTSHFNWCIRLFHWGIHSLQLPFVATVITTTIIIIIFIFIIINLNKFCPQMTHHTFDSQSNVLRRTNPKSDKCLWKEGDDSLKYVALPRRRPLTFVLKSDVRNNKARCLAVDTWWLGCRIISFFIPDNHIYRRGASRIRGTASRWEWCPLDKGTGPEAVARDCCSKRNF